MYRDQLYLNAQRVWKEVHNFQTDLSFASCKETNRKNGPITVK